MGTAANARLDYESGQTSHPMTELTNAGDNRTFDSGVEYWSGRSGYEPVVRPDGLLNGGVIEPGGNDEVAVGSCSAYLAGEQIVVAAGTVAISRPATDVAKVISIIIDSAGDLAAVDGTDGATAAFSEVRGEAGGPPLIPAGAIEIGQVRVATASSAPVLATQIFQVVGLHQERATYPQVVTDQASGRVECADARPAIHADSEHRRVVAIFAEPIFVEIDLASDFKPAEESYTTNSTQVYNSKTIGSSSKSLGQASFTAYLEDGVSDPLVKLKGENLWFRVYPNV